MNRQLLPLIALSIAIILYPGCGKDKSTNISDYPTIGRGDIITVTEIASFTPTQINEAADQLGLTLPFIPDLQVDAFSIHYLTIDETGSLAEASGALILPESGGNLNLIGINRTISSDAILASVDPAASLPGLVALVAASSNNIVFLPDYLGFGKSDTPHPYYHYTSSTTVIVDMIQAIYTYCADNGFTLSKNLLLTGEGEGAYMALAAHREIERNYGPDIVPIATAPIAGCYNLSQALDDMLGDLSYPYPIVTAALITSHNNIYHWDRLEEIFTPTYAAELTTLFNGTLSYSEIVSRMPSTNANLCQASFVGNYLAGTDSLLASSLVDNSLLGWTPSAPINFYHGDDDAKFPLDWTFAIRDSLTDPDGGEINLITIPGATHEATAATALWNVLDWFLCFTGGCEG